MVGKLRDWDGVWNDEEYGWLLKVDKNGCFEPGCITSDSLDLIAVNSEFVITSTYNPDIENDSISNTNNFVVFLNPVYNKLSLKTNLNLVYSNWQIYNETGIMIKQGYFDQNSHLSIENLNYLTSGIYYLKILDKNNIYLGSAKFIKI